MKKSFFYAGILAAGLMTVSTSCSKDEEIINGGDNTEVAAGEQVIVLDVQNTDILSTKSRPLYSTENQGAEKVTDVKLFIFKEVEVTGTKTMQLQQVLDINDWENSEDYSYGRQYTLKLKDKLTETGTYTILAVGQDESATTGVLPLPYTINWGVGSGNPTGPSASFISELATWAGSTPTNFKWINGSNSGEGFLTTTALHYTNVADGHLAGEIFSGTSDPITINLTSEETSTGFTAKVLLKRQVAGVIGYFNRIPAFVKTSDDGTAADDYTAVKKIRLVASNRNNQLDLTYNLAVQKDDDTHTSINDKDLENVVNGFSTNAETKDAWYKATGSSSAKDAYIVYEIDLADWFTTASATNDDATYWYTDGTYSAAMTIPTLGEVFAGATVSPTWRNKYSSVNNGPYVATNSVLAGEFVIPFDKVDETNTFELQLIGTGVSGETVLKSWNVALQDVVPGLDDTKYIHNIYRNQLYQIGQRGGGDNPDNPGEGGDKPQPLDKDQELTIRINDSWEIIHDMEIE